MLLRQALVWIVIYFLILAINHAKKKYLFLSGLFTSLTLLVSPELGIITMIILLIYCTLQLKSFSNLRAVFYDISYFSLGFILPTLIFVGFSLKEGWFIPYLSNTIKVLIDYTGVNVPNGKSLPYLFSLIPSSKSLIAWIKFITSKDIFIYYVFLLHILVISYLAMKITLKTFSPPDKKIFLIVIFGIFLQYLIVGRPDHYFFALSPILLISIYYLNKSILFLKQKKIKNTEKLFFIAAIIFFSIFYLRYLYINHPQIENIVHISSAVMHSPQNPKFVGRILISKSQAKLFTDIQNFTNQNSSAKDSIFIFSDEPGLYLVLNRDNATKYVVPFGSNLKPMRIDLVNELKDNHPKFILIDKNAWDVDGVSNFRRLPEVINYIKQNYKVFKTIDGISFYTANI